MGKISRFLAVFGLLATLAGAAHAQALKPLPELSPGFDINAYAAKTAEINRAYDNIPNVAYKVSLPATWLEQVTLGQDFGELTRLNGPSVGDVRPYFSFKRLQVARENSARNELISYLLKQGYTLRSFREIDDRNVEAQYVFVGEDNVSYVVRAMVRIEGPAMLIAEYALPVALWGQMADQQTFAIKSFKFTKDSDESIENRVTRQYHQSLTFKYPASWVFLGEAAPTDNVAVLTLSSPGPDGRQSGNIRMGVYSERSLIAPGVDPKIYTLDFPGLIKDVKARAVADKFDVSAAIDRRTPILGIKTKFAALEVYNLSRHTSDYDNARQAAPTQELWVAVFQTDEALPRSFIIELRTPTRSQDLYQWSVNTRAFNLILKSIQ